MGNLATGGVTGRDLAIGRANLVTGRANLVTARAKLVTGRINLVTGKVVPTSSRTNQTKSNRKFAASGPNPPPHPRSLQPPRRNQRRHHHDSTLKKSSSSTSNFWNGETADCFLSKCPSQDLLTNPVHSTCAFLQQRQKSGPCGRSERDQNRR